MGLRLAVALVRSLVVAEPGDVCVAIDVLRATTTLSVLFARGCRAVWLAADVESARRFGRNSGRLLCGEVGGLAPPGFDYGNSPVEFSRLDLTGREVVFATTNGTGTLRACAAGDRVFAGAFVNAGATVRSALRALDEPGRADRRLLIACAGTRGHFGIEDAACAGLIVRLVQAARPDASLDDAAEAARRLFDSFPGPLDAVGASAHAGGLRELGLGDDVAFSARVDATEVVPELRPDAAWPLYLVD
jgi:2-phosphosulfolactate phosphatase